ncbi:phosphotransferase [Desertihabitans aurantiacus]|uniref:phosphotransferase n=1 Tax=Desertihabitans aurantiacus TaxID=2282477 RepID=UPI001300B336|nr:phosphotransferase [Desertihabitans aurantiacus]
MSTPAELSPTPLEPGRPVALPFGLTWADLRAAFEHELGAEGRAVVSHAKRGRHQGGHPSVILTVSCDPQERHCSRTLFFKLNRDGSREAQRYRFLTERGVPVPQLVVCVEREGEEVLGLQLLPSIGIGPDDVEEVLRLVATLNSLTGVPADIGSPPPGLPPEEFEARLSEALDELDGVFADHGPSGWLDTYRHAARVYRDLPQALTHGELAPQQLGRTEDGTLVLLDLATLGRRARFADIANLLPTLAELSGRDERLIFADYLRFLADGSALALDEQLWDELRLTRFVQAVEALPWHLSLGDDTELDRRLRTIASDVAAVRAGGGGTSPSGPPP